MAGLGFSFGGGMVMPYVKVDAKAGRIFRCDRVEQGGQWTEQKVDISAQFRVLMDLDAIEVGWIAFPAGAPPQKTLVRIGQPRPAQPSPLHKEGLRVIVYAPQILGQVREITGNARAILDGFNQLYIDHESARASQPPGHVPIVRLVDMQPKTTPARNGQPAQTNYTPRFVIEGYVARPVDFVDGVPGATAAAAPQAAPATFGSPSGPAPATFAPPPGPAPAALPPSSGPVAPPAGAGFSAPGTPAQPATVF